MKNYFVSIIIPTREINSYITRENLPSFTKQTSANFEVIVLPNNPDKHDASLTKQYKWLRIIPTGKITRPAEKRDVGAANAKGDILAFIDDDAFPSPDWLEQAIELITNYQLPITNRKEKGKCKDQKNICNSSLVISNSDKQLAAVCGPGILPPNAKYWEKVFDAVLKTWIGAGGYGYRFNPEKERLIDDYPSMNFLVKKDVFLKVGGFNSDYWPGEDSKLCEDIVYKEGKKILYSPQVIVYHHRRNSLTAYLKQHGNYGFHRGAFFAHGDKNSRRLSYLIPSGFVIYILLLLIYAFISPNVILALRIEGGIHIIIPLILYFIAEMYLFLKTLLLQRNLKIAAGAVLVLFLTHVVYGILFIKGFFIGLLKRENIYGNRHSNN